MIDLFAHISDVWNCFEKALLLLLETSNGNGRFDTFFAQLIVPPKLIKVNDKDCSLREVDTLGLRPGRGRAFESNCIARLTLSWYSVITCSLLMCHLGQNSNSFK